VGTQFALLLKLILLALSDTIPCGTVLGWQSAVSEAVVSRESDAFQSLGISPVERKLRKESKNAKEI
jgi:hypothetical protein